MARWAGPVAVLAVLAVAAWVLHHQLRLVHYPDLVHQFTLLSRARIDEAIGLALAADSVLPGFAMPRSGV